DRVTHDRGRELHGGSISDGTLSLDECRGGARGGERGATCCERSPGACRESSEQDGTDGKRGNGAHGSSFRCQHNAHMSTAPVRRAVDSACRAALRSRLSVAARCPRAPGVHSSTSSSANSGFTLRLNCGSFAPGASLRAVSKKPVW